MAKLVIGFIGKKWTGKDFGYTAIKELYPDAIRVALADSLKEEFIQEFNNTLKWDDYYDLKQTWIKINRQFLEENKKQFRTSLQKFGDAKKAIDSAYFINTVITKINDAPDDSLIVITDIRLQEELEHLTIYNAIAGYEFFTIKISPKFTCDDVDFHRTEKEVDSLMWDLLIENDLTFKYSFAVQNIVSLLREKVKLEDKYQNLIKIDDRKLERWLYYLVMNGDVCYGMINKKDIKKLKNIDWNHIQGDNPYTYWMFWSQENEEGTWNPKFIEVPARMFDYI